MRNRKIVALAAAIAWTWTWPVRAADAPPADHVQAMKDLAAFVQALTKPDAEQDLQEARRWVPIVRDAFAIAGNYWNAKNETGLYHPEVTTTQEAIKAASDMGVAATLGSAEGVAASVKDIAGRCQPCHDTHREKAPDGTFLIK